MKKIIGNKYQSLTVIEEIDRYPTGERRFFCRCKCGNGAIRGYKQLTRKDRFNECGQCWDIKRKEKAKKSKKKAVERNRTPKLHTCGRPYSEHQKCKACTIVLCETTDPGEKAYCKDCQQNGNMLS